MMTKEEYYKIFEQIKNDLFKDCISEDGHREWDTDFIYKSIYFKINESIQKLLKDKDSYYEITDVINYNLFEKAIKDVYFTEINELGYLESRWSGFETTKKCYLDYDGDLEKIKSVISNKLEILKDKVIEELKNTYEQYIRVYEVKKDYIEFADKIKTANFVVCDFQRRGDIRVPCTFSKEIGTLTLFVRKNVSNYRIYMKCNVGGRYGMTVEEFDESYKILKQESNNIKNALLGEDVI